MEMRAMARIAICRAAPTRSHRPWAFNPRYRARNAAILSASGPIAVNALRCPFGPTSVPLSTEPPAAAIFAIVYDQFVEYQIIGRVKHKRRHFDVGRIDRGQLIGVAQIQKMIGVGDEGTCAAASSSACSILNLLAGALAGSLPSTAGAVPKVLRAQSQLLACSDTTLSAALSPSSGGSLP